MVAPIVERDKVLSNISFKIVDKLHSRLRDILQRRHDHFQGGSIRLAIGDQRELGDLVTKYSFCGRGLAVSRKKDFNRVYNRFDFALDLQSHRVF